MVDSFGYAHEGLRQAPGDAHLVKVMKRFQIDRTLAYSLVLFNAVPKRSGLVKYPDVPMHSLRARAPSVFLQRRLVAETGQSGACVSVRKPVPFNGTGL